MAYCDLDLMLAADLPIDSGGVTICALFFDLIGVHTHHAYSQQCAYDFDSVKWNVSVSMG